MRKLKGKYNRRIETEDDVVLTGAVMIHGNLKCKNISCEGERWNIDAWDINAWNINARNIDAGDIDARDINAWNIICEKRIKKSENNKTTARLFVQNKSMLKRKEW